MSARIRIVIEDHQGDYPWPCTAVLQAKDGKDWVEVDAWGGDSHEEAIATLRTENARAQRAKVWFT